MTTVTPISRPTAYWLLADSCALARRTLNHWRAQPFSLVMTLAFPLLMVVMFNYLMGGAMSIAGSYTDFLVPGLLVMTMVFGLDSTLQAVSTDFDRGVTDRFRSLPMTPGAVLIGRCLADMLASVVSLALMIGAGFVIGWRPVASAGGWLAAIGLLLLLRFAMLWLGIFLGTHVRGASALMAAQVVEWPLMFLSSIFVSPTTMPPWLAAISQFNPLSASATATRTLLGAPAWDMTGWAAQHAMALAVFWPVALLAAFVPLAIGRYTRLGR